MSDTKKTLDRKPGENPRGKFHYNPVNMAGKKSRIVERQPQEADETTDQRNRKDERDSRPKKR